ncbi:MAG: cupin domain-containing protein [Myxococcota bacterium]|nr:cupin domain-containing protein [Myxococcota bacterium]
MSDPNASSSRGAPSPSADPDAPLNGDLARRVAIDTTQMEWTPSPSPSVLRKRLHRVGPAESGQVTSLVAYLPDSKFPPHDHPEGEEILVLDGVFSDEFGDWGAGTYLLNPEGFRHAPFSREGCLIFVKLRQAAGDREHVAVRHEELAWEPSDRSGVERKALHVQDGFEDTTWLERWVPGADPGERVLEGGAELLVIEGTWTDEHGEYGAGSWLRLPAGTRQRPRSEGGCTLYVKYGGLPGLRGA